MQQECIGHVLPYTSLPEYLKDVLAVAHHFLALYRRFAVLPSPDGNLYHLRGNMIFGSTSNPTAETDFSMEEVDAYTRASQEITHFMNEMHERCLASDLRIPMDELFTYFNLTLFEQYAVILAFSVEIDRSFERTFAFLQDDFDLKCPTLDFCLKSFTLDTFLQKELLLLETRTTHHFFDFFFIPPDTALSSLVSRRLRLERRIVDFFLGKTALDPALASFCQLLLPAKDICKPLPVQQDIAEKLITLCQANTEKQALFICGSVGSGRKTQLHHACSALNWPLLTVDCRALPPKEHMIELLQKILREATLQGAKLCFSLSENTAEKTEIIRAILSVVFHKHSLVFFTTNASLTIEGKKDFSGNIIEIIIPALSIAEREILWQEHLSSFAAEIQRCAVELSVKFNFSPGQIMQSVKDAQIGAVWNGHSSPDRQMLHRSCRSQIQTQLGERAISIAADYNWEDLILPPEQKESLHRLCDQLRFAHQIYEVWGFNDKGKLGRGLSALFYGPPGTGKTMAAQTIAKELELDLYRIDLSAILSKYIGETQKNLGNVFDEVKKSQGILFFDEADALFGRRTEIKDVNDRYANADTAFLLQKIESYDGIVLLATNYYQNFDEAFKRRIKFTIEFPLPGPKERLAIWQKAFPPAAPLHSDIDFDWLAAKFDLTGSNIKNIALAAAFLSAANQTNITMPHIVTSLKEELKKLGRCLPPEEIRRYSI